MNGFSRTNREIVIDRAKQRLLGGRSGDRGQRRRPGRRIRPRGECIPRQGDPLGEGETEKERGRKGNGILQCSFGIVLTFFVLENVRVLLVNDDATVAGFSETEWKQGFLLFKPFIRYRSLELERFPLFPDSFFFPLPTSLFLVQPLCVVLLVFSIVSR